MRPCPAVALSLALLLATALAGSAAHGAMVVPPALSVTPDLVVAADGSGTHRTLQSALDSIPRDNRERRIVLIRDGRYLEKIRIDAPCVTLHGESRAGVRIEFAQAAEDFKAHPDALGIAVVNLAATASDCVIENLTIANTRGAVGPHAFALHSLADRTIIAGCNVWSDGADTLSPWRQEEAPPAVPVAGQPAPPAGGRTYLTGLDLRGSVDLLCPRGWCYIADSSITQVNPNATAAVWHDGALNPDMKFVLRRCRFDGPPGWFLARHHVDAQFYFVDCTFAATLRDRPPYRVIYPLAGGAASEADAARNRELGPRNRWGERSFYFNTHRAGGDYAWHADNLAAAPVPPAPDQVNASWTFGRTWDPERTQPPAVRRITAKGDSFAVEFTEVVTVKGTPALQLTNGARLGYASGSGTDTLRFTSSAAGSRAAAAGIDLNGGAIVVTEATAQLLAADLTLPAPSTELPAFPGAEGFGASTRGGRGGRVLLVTTLADDGPGSFRAACDAEGPRIVVFRVSGTITLRRPLTVSNPFLTIAGQSAPGDGICLRDYTFGVATHDVVVRYLRFRLGDATAQQTDSADFLPGATNCIYDHCSATWSIDECLSLSGNIFNVTVQWCLIGQPLHHSKHAKGPHGLGSLSRATGPVTWHHNLWLHTHSRNPRLGDNYGRPPYPLFDVRNNVVYNYIEAAAGLTQGNFGVNYVGNFIRPGPDTRTAHPIHVGFPSALEFHLRDNVVDGDEAQTTDNARMFNALAQDGKTQVRFRPTPFATAPVTTTPAREAFEMVLASAGASRPRRDRVDAQLVTDVRTRSGRVIDTQESVGGWPELASTPPPPDRDADGMPDAWETAHGLNPADAGDGSADRDSDGYTNIEEYLNALATH